MEIGEAIFPLIASNFATVPKGTSANASGNVTNTSPGPTAGSRPVSEDDGEDGKAGKERDRGVREHRNDGDFGEIDVVGSIGREGDHQA